jgi:CubicO group peptidase (beta-lactamase class C family)
MAGTRGHMLKLQGIFFGAVLIFAALAGCATQPAPYSGTGAAAAWFSRNEWRTSTPEEQGIDSRGIVKMLEKIVSEDLPVHSFLLIRNGYLVTEAYFTPAERDQPHLLYSMTKSVTSALVGIAIGEGIIKGVDQKVLDFFPDIREENADPYLAGMTIENLLTMSAGYKDILAPAPGTSRDWVREFFNRKIANTPGSVFLYNSGCAHVLSAVMQTATGRTLFEYAREKLFTPLGIDSVYWLSDSTGRSIGNSWMKLRPVDMAKFGCLFLNRGMWNGRRIVPEEWVAQSTARRMDTRGKMNAAEDDGYGYLWWMNSFGGCSAHGFGGQYIFVLPEFNTVAVFTGGFADPGFPTSHELMKTFIVPALGAQGPLPKNDESNGALAALVEKIGRALATPCVLPPIAMEISGKTYTFDPGKTGLKSLTYHFDTGEEYRLVVKSSSGGTERTFEYRGGLDGAYRTNDDSADPAWTNIVALKGAWQEDGTFVETDRVTDGVSEQTLTHTFDANGVQFVHFVESSGGRIVGSGILVGYAEE